MQPEGEVIPLESRRAAKMEKMEGPPSALVAKREMEDLRARWTAVQAAFVDDPRKSVQEADELVSSAIQQISESFREQRSRLEKQWSKGGEASTEDLRLSLQQYRTFFERLLSM